MNVTGCRFKYHQQFEGHLSVTILDVNMAVVKEFTSLSASKAATVTNAQASVDVYATDTVIIDSYVDIGSYARCQLVRQGIADPVLVMSNPSEKFNVSRKY